MNIPMEFAGEPGKIAEGPIDAIEVIVFCDEAGRLTTYFDNLMPAFVRAYLTLPRTGFAHPPGYYRRAKLVLDEEVKRAP